MNNFITWFEEIELKDIGLVGGKNASLGEMVQCLSKEGIAVPTGFIITADAYSELIREGKISESMSLLLKDIDKNNIAELSQRSQAVRSLIKKAGLPTSVITQISDAYRKLESRYGNNVDVAVRSSATAEDLPEASFAGQQESFLNVRGEQALLEACLNCFASLFTDRAVSYRIDNNFDHMGVRLSIGVQKMVRSDLASSGVIFTLDPESGFRNVVLVSSAYGLGENIVAGRVDPDEFLVFKPSLPSHSCPIIRHKLGAKQLKLIYSGHGSHTTKNIAVTPEDRARFSLSNEEVLTLARWACRIEEHYTRRYGRLTAMDIEWAKDGTDNKLYIVQARPETTHLLQESRTLTTYRLTKPGTKLLSGRAVGEHIGSGRVRALSGASDLGSFKDGEVLVADMTDPDWEPIMKRAAAIITNRGGRTCHAAIVSREIGVPCIVGTQKATELLVTGREVTVSCAEGGTGIIYDGILPYEKKEIQLDELPETKTRLLVNLGNPEHALALASLPVDGVGLAREEFIIANEIKVHPLALTRFDEVKDPQTREAIKELTRSYATPTDYFVEKLAEGVGMIAAAFYPKQVIVRLSDFKTNEYANLLGGKYFEPKEDNPMIGFRGASRYYDDRYRDGFALECRALLKAREDMGLINIKIMVPFCRTVKEGQMVLDEMSKNGLARGKNGLEVYMMCELPSNVLCIDEFAQLFDGFSIGSNDLTQLTLGLDRDSELVARLFDERDLSVKRAITQAISGAKRHGRKIGICGQAPSDYPEIVKFLVEQGIDTISLSEDVILKTLLSIAEIESQTALVRA